MILLRYKIKILNSIMIILLSGKRYSGKDFVGDILVKKFNFKKKSLATAVKKNYCKIKNLDYNTFMNDRKIKEEHRQYLIDYSEGKKKQDPYYWCKILNNSIKENDNVVICDLRYMDELKYFQNIYPDAPFIRIHASLETRQERNWTPSEIDSSESETLFDDYPFDFIITNDTYNNISVYKQIDKCINILQSNKEIKK